MRLAARLHAIGQEQYSRMRRALTPTTSGDGGGASDAALAAAEGDAEANVGPSRMQNRRQRLIRKKPEKMRHGHWERALVINEVLAVDRWGVLMW